LIERAKQAVGVTPSAQNRVSLRALLILIAEADLAIVDVVKGRAIRIARARIANVASAAARTGTSERRTAATRRSGGFEEGY
jgi:hypothetical protein